MNAAHAEATIVYEVNVEVETEIAAAYRAWLHDHIAEILALPGFVDASAFEVLDPSWRVPDA